MKILLISQYYPPEVGALATRMSSLAMQLKRKGHDVTVIAEIPNYPSGTVSSKYKYKFIVKEKYEGINVIRTFVCANSRKTNLQRMRFYISFMISSIISGMFLEKFEIVLATSPPLFVGISGYVLSRLMGCRLVLDIRDLWPESAVSLGELKSERLINLAEKLEHFLYSKADKVSIAVPGFRSRLLKKNVKDDKIVDFPNGVDFSLFSPHDSRKAKMKYGFGDKFIVLFSGNHGLAQGLNTILKSAELLLKNREILFVFVGSGVEKDNLIKQRDKIGLNNVIFLPESPHKEMPEIISMADVCIVPLRNLPLFTNAIPSKMFEYMACRKPIISTLIGEGDKLIREAKSGITVQPENEDVIASSVLKLYNDIKLIEELGANGYAFVKHKYSRNNIFNTFDKKLRSLKN
ncbi:glycosyltransferase family 4 protein [candidate division KSB1 bacterium]|nr:glycosyltransferase family 4 protein [candidate division KSB1 bacterium]